MDPAEWLQQFRGVHERARSGQLSTEERAQYLRMREELARSLVAAQGLVVPNGQNARRHFRVAQVYQVEISNLYRCLTKELSRMGFSAVVPTKLKQGEVVTFALTLARAAEPLQGRAQVVASVPQAGGSRVSFSFDSLNEDDSERLELALFDAVLSRLG